MAGRPAQPVDDASRRRHEVDRRERHVDRRARRLVRAFGERRGGLEAPPPEPGRRGGRLAPGAHPCGNPGRANTSGTTSWVGPDSRSVVGPRGREESHQPRLVDGLDRQRAGVGRLDHVERAIVVERGPDHLGPVRRLERRLEARRLELALGGVQPVAIGGEDPHAGDTSEQEISGLAGPPRSTASAASRRGTARGTWPAAACPTTSSAACRAATSTTSRRREPARVGDAARCTAARTGAVGVVVGLRLGHDHDRLPPVLPSTPKAITLPARTPSTSATARSMSSGNTLRPPTMITSLMRPHITSSPSTR